MATINSTAIGGMYLQADYTVTTNTAANTSTVAVTLKLVSHYALYASAMAGSYISVGGSKTEYSKSISYGGSTTTTTTLATKTVIVSHNSDGTGTCNISGTFVMNGTYRGYSVGTMSINSTITLPKIARASGLTVPASVNTGSVLSGTIAPSSTAFNHKVLLKIGSTTKATVSVAAGTNSWSYTIPHDWLPNTTSQAISVVLETYNGTTLVASVTKSTTANVPTSIVPSVSAFTAAIAANGKDGLYVQGKTTAKLTATATAGSGATIKSYTYGGPNVSTTVTTASTITTSTIQSSGTLTYSVEVQDSRGRKANKTVSIYVYPYSTPSIGSVSVQRCTSNGTISDSGTYARYTVNSSYSPVNGKNTRTVTVAYSSNNGSSYSAATTLQAVADTTGSKTGTYGDGAFAVSGAYVLKFTITDSYGATYSATTSLQSAARPINIRSNGKGVAIGAMSTKNEFECSMPADFNSTVNIDNTTTINASLNVTNGINAKSHIYMGGAYGQTGELHVKFSNPDTSTNRHHAYLYGGNPNSTTAIGMYDALNSRGIFQYLDGSNRITIGNSNADIYFNGGKVDDFVVENGASGVWAWRKWNSGRMEVYGTASHNPTALNDGVNSVTVTMPVSFANTSFRVLITPAKCGLLVTRFGDCASNSDITHAVNSFVLSYRYNHSTAYTTNFNVEAVGTWK